MNDKTKDQMSAFLDDELPEAEAELLLRRLDSHTELRRAAESYLLIGQAMRGELGAATTLRHRVSRALDGEAGHAAAPVQRETRWLRPLTGVAIAAGVAVAAVMSLQGGGNLSSTDTLTADSPPEDPGYTVPATVASPGPLGPPPARLTNYMISHGERAGTLARSGMHSRIVTLRDGADGTESEAESETVTDEAGE